MISSVGVQPGPLKVGGKLKTIYGFSLNWPDEVIPKKMSCSNEPVLLQTFQERQYFPLEFLYFPGKQYSHPVEGDFPYFTTLGCTPVFTKQ